jgi:dolichyl-phosphate-mannose-protein mannosyltransferase
MRLMAAAAVEAPNRASTAAGAELLDRLVRPMPTDRLAGWLLPLAVTLFAGVIRFLHLSTPRALVFDEVYYAHDANNLLHVGVELNPGNTGPGFIVHPPIGKWMISVGEALFHGHGTFLYKGAVYPVGSFGWRFSSALVGTLAVLILARTARRMFRSTLLGTVAGLLFCLDGLEFVQSRVSMLDIFLLFWVVAAFACLVVDRDDGRIRLATRAGAGDPDAFLWRPWRIAAGVCLGLACATKWNGLFFVPPFLLLAFAWDFGARRRVEADRPVKASVVKDTLPSIGLMVVLPALIYVASWTGWFLGDAATAWDHDLYVHHGQSWLAHAIAVFHGWFTYQGQIWHFHTTLTAGHPYRSNPLGWIVLARPVAYFYNGSTHACGSTSCAQEVLGVGTPAIWWASIPALLACCWQWLRRHDWRSAAVVACFAFAWLPWFWEAHKDRTMFLFYMLPALPFMVLAITQCAGLILGPVGAGLGRRRWGAATVGAYLLVVLWNFSFLYPVLAGQTITYHQWHNRMLFQNCTNGNDRHETSPCWI